MKGFIKNLWFLWAILSLAFCISYFIYYEIWFLVAHIVMAVITVLTLMFNKNLQKKSNLTETLS